MRGSPHAHMLLWLEDVPDFNTAEGKQFVDDNVTCSLVFPYLELVKKYQIHKCTETCYKNKKDVPRRCRFGYPFAANPETVVRDDEDTVRHHGIAIVIKREENESMVNNYNLYLLNILKCNHDIQVITDSAGVAYYIAKYMSKAEAQGLRKEVNAAINRVNSGAPSTFKSLAFRLHNKREVSAQEAAFRLCHLALHLSSVKVEFIPAFMKDKRLRLLKLNELERGEVKFRSNIIEKYEMRPPSLANLCLFEFTALFDPITNAKFNELDKNLDSDDEDDNKEVIETIYLRNRFGQKREQ